MTGCKINGAALPCDTPFWSQQSCFIRLCLPQLTFSARFIPFNPSTRQEDAQVIQIMPAFLPNITRNSPGDEIANVNFLYDDIVHVLQNTIDSCTNSATDRRGGYVLERMFAKFSEITQCNGHYAVQDHSRSQILVPVESSYTTSY